MQRKVELKFEIAPRDAERLRRDPLLAWAPVTEEHQTSIYFDTPKRRLRKAGYTLRVRRSGKATIQTIKASGSSAGLFDRAEWESRVRSMRPDLKAARRTPVADVLTERRAAKLGPVVQMTIDRTSWDFDDADCLVEVSVDQNGQTHYDYRVRC